ncbi:hypothetical protein ACIA8O_04790 [Kitasatospora sp. NPDC051853]|uniref:hypothetical protein n=1 Tax=Kitasatospora sp. NPDC051853 TaxID=3364058 RepID=UPI0037BC4397
MRAWWWRAAVAVVVCTAAAGTAVAEAGAPQERARAQAEGAPEGLRVVHVSVDPVRAHGVTTVRALIANHGPGAVGSDFTATVRVPLRALASGAHFPRTCRLEQAELSCTFRKGLPLLRTATVLIPVRLAEDVRDGERLEGGLVTVDDPDRPGRTHSRAFSIDVG